MRKKIRIYVFVAGLIFMTCLCALMLGMAQKQESMLESSLYEHAAALSDLIVITRSWSLAFGGVFVKKGPGVVSNPYLENPDIVDSNGVEYTRKIPTIITNELSSLAKSSKGITFRITSLKLINPNNAPDAWEKAALEEFELGKPEKTGFVNKGGSEFYRLMRPLYIKESCLSCHSYKGYSYTTPEQVSVSAEEQDYKLGDVRGGITVDVQATEIKEAIRNNYITMIGLLVVLILIFSATLYLFVWKLMNKMEDQRAQLEQKDKELQDAYQIIKAQKDRMEKELNVGREIQMSMLPLIFPAFPDRQELSVYAVLEPAREVGGDFYDFFFLDNERFCFVIGDVSGKGVPSALFMAVTKTLIKSRAADDNSTASILTHVNEELSSDNKAYMFVTVFIGILNTLTGEMQYTNAGHNPPYILRKSGSLEALAQRHGPVIGAVKGLAYKEDTTSLLPGDIAYLYTDGVTEAKDRNNSLFSEKRLEDVLSSRQYVSTEDVVKTTVEETKRFEQDVEQADDITVMAVEYYGVKDKPETRGFEVTIKNRMTEIGKVIQRFDAFSDEQDLDVKIRREIKMVFDEMLNNIISYAFRQDEEHEIEVKMELTANRLTTILSDDGIPFNPFGIEVPDTDLPLEQRKIGGLGLHLVRNVMDEVSYQRKIEKNVVTLTKIIN